MFFSFIIPLTLLSAVFNMLFAYYGDTVLFTLFSRDFTLEPLFYGFCRGMMFSTVICGFPATAL
ncbi:MAG: hypothetical protein LUG95_04460 [Clostridiales bacterium]|nr:hypothetical protein [Clostridiales bacterium]